jgi:hypothetical protein
LRQAIQIGREAFLLRAGATEWAPMTSNLTLNNGRPAGFSAQDIQFIADYSNPKESNPLTLYP